MAQLISLTKVGIYDGYGSQLTVTSEAIRVAVENISSVETHTSGSQVMLREPQKLDGDVITGYVVSQTPAQIQTLIDTVSDSIAASDGTVAAPSISFSGDTDSGAYRIGANNIGVAVNGAKVLDIATTGLGITGTATVSSTTASTTKDTGALIVEGGAGIEKEIYAGLSINAGTYLTSGNGTVALPAIGPVSDPNTGIYVIGADNLGVACNGAKVLDIATTGLGVTGTLSATGALSGTDFTSTGKVIHGGTPQTLTGAGAVNLTTYATLLVTTAADALTLADGTEGQHKYIQLKTDGGDGTLTPTNLRGGTTITFDDAGDFVLLYFIDGEWSILSNSGCTVA